MLPVGVGRVSTVKTFKNMRLCLWRDSNPIVPDEDLEMRWVFRQGKGDEPAPFIIRDCIGQEDFKQLRDSLRITLAGG